MMMETVYYTCLNNACEKHRNVFVEGDPDHAGCERRRLYLEGQEERRTIPWGFVAAAAVLALGAAGFVFYRRMAKASASAEPRPTFGEGQARQTWSGEHSQSDERRGHAVPPPIA